MQAGMVPVDPIIPDAAANSVSPNLLRSMWAAVERCVSSDGANDLFDLSDQHLIQKVLTHWPHHLVLDAGEQSTVQQYLGQRVNLIRDLIEV
jgi:hypothetical protein